MCCATDREKHMHLPLFLAIGSSLFSGKRTDYTNVKVKIVRDYKVFYDEAETAIEILTIWDTRQDPDKLNNY